METEPTNLTAVVLDEVDRIQHTCWKHLAPDYAGQLETDMDRRNQDLCLQYFRKLDGVMEKMVEKAGSEATVILVSDHGFGPSEDIFYINTWLEKKGLLTWKPGVERDRTVKDVRIPKPNEFVAKLDWKKTKAISCTMMSNGIYIPVAGQRGPDGVNPSEYEKVRSEITRLLLDDCKHPVTGAPMVKRVATREEVYGGRFCHRAPDLTFFLADDSFAAQTPSEEVMIHRDEVMGSHMPNGIFMARGPGIRKGEKIGSLNIVDVVPAVLYSLGLAIPSDLEGAVPLEAYEPAWLAKRPPKKGEATVSPERAAALAGKSEPGGEKEKEAIMKRLQDLGYTE
jgi:predicted AlkP superfamily phosphohydrolase/phosphomutase